MVQTEKISLDLPEFDLKNKAKFFRGKVRDNYKVFIDGQPYLISIATNRISAHDVVLPIWPRGKGRILTEIAREFFMLTQHIVPNWVLHCPHPNVCIGKFFNPFKIEMVIRGYLSGHAWREYQNGKRMICGVPMPDGMRENDPFPEPIITPTTKEAVGVHDQDISRDEIIRQGLVVKYLYPKLECYTRKLFDFGSTYARERGLLLLDTKYEFGEADGTIFLLDEIHTPDSSRYIYADGYEERQAQGESQRPLSKEFVRGWLAEHNYHGKEGEKLPKFSPEFVRDITDRYAELFLQMTGRRVEQSWLLELNPDEILTAIMDTLPKLGAAA